MKKCCVKPVQSLELEFEDGKSLLLTFDMEALYHFYDIGEGISEIIEEKSVPKMCAKIIFASAVYNQPDFTLDQAIALVSNMSPVTITEIINEFTESMGSTKNEVQKELSKKMMEIFLEKLAKK
jgi:hypothetical protein